MVSHHVFQKAIDQDRLAVSGVAPPRCNQGATRNRGTHIGLVSLVPLEIYPDWVPEPAIIAPWARADRLHWWWEPRGALGTPWLSHSQTPTRYGFRAATKLHSGNSPTRS